MRLQKGLLIFLTLILCISQKSTASKISDYSFESTEEKDKIIASNRNAEKCVAITFDDGPHPKYTPEILDILQKYNAKATFFVIGENAKKHPEIIKKEYDQGHEIGNHTFSHPDLRSISAEQFVQEIEKTQAAIEEITGERPKLFRPPGGYLNNNIVDELLLHKYNPVLWSWRQDSMDWTCPSVESIVNTVMNNLRDGDIILFHDFISKNSPTPAALEIILKRLTQQGYSFLTVSELNEV